MVLGGLLLGIVGQAAVTAVGALVVASPAAEAPDLLLGDSWSALRGTTLDGSSSSLVLPGDRPTIVYAFNSTCEPSNAVGTLWSRHFAKPLPVRRIAVSLDHPADAATYARRFGWKIDLLSAFRLAPTAPERVLASRTPWVFVFDADGVLAHAGHGSSVPELERVVRELTKGIGTQ